MSDLSNFNNIYANLAESAYNDRPNPFPYESLKRKKKNILNSGLVDSIDKTKFNDINDKFELGLEFDSHGNILMNEEKTWQILALLNDDYLNSDLTSLNYEAQGKVKK